MKIIFAGNTDFSLVSLRSLVDFCQQSKNFELTGVYTSPAQKVGRGRFFKKSIVQEYAEVYKLPVYQPLSFKQPSAQETLKALNPDLMVVVAYGLILPSSVLAVPTLGCINVHASLLPKWRGAAPIQRALLAGDDSTGITIMQMDEGLDTGDILYQVSMPILNTDTAKNLTTKLANVGAKALLDTLRTLSEKQRLKKLQPEKGVLYAKKLTKEEGNIDWLLAATVIERQIRAFNPFPISFSWIQHHKIRIWAARVKPCEGFHEKAPGTILEVSREGIQVAAGEGVIQITHAQKEGRRCLPVADLLNGFFSFLKPGMRFQNHP